MKFTSLAIVVSSKCLVQSVAAFTPGAAGVVSTANRRIITTTSPFAVTAPYSTTPAPRSATMTQLNLFGLRKKKNGNKAKGDVTEAEVRALFELWNAALATGDSRIVASRYTKVRLWAEIANNMSAPFQYLSL